MRQLSLPDLAATEALATRLALLAVPGDVIALSGPLGAGKTAFARAFIRALGVAEEVPSPTFSLVQTYLMPDGREIAHFDLYRLESPDDVWELGWEEALVSAIVLVEWPERLGPVLLPKDRLAVRLELSGTGEARRAEITGFGIWCARLPGMGTQET